MRQPRPMLFVDDNILFGGNRTYSQRVELFNPLEKSEFPVIAEKQFFDFTQYYPLSESYSDNAMNDILSESARCKKFLQSNPSKYEMEEHTTVVLYCDSTKRSDTRGIFGGFGSKDSPFVSLSYALNEVWCIAYAFQSPKHALYFKIHLTGEFKDEQYLDYHYSFGKCAPDIHVYFDGGDRNPVVERCFFPNQDNAARNEHSIHFYFKGVTFKQTYIYSTNILWDKDPVKGIKNKLSCDYIHECTIDKSSHIESLVIEDSEIKDSFVKFLYCSNCVAENTAFDTLETGYNVVGGPPPEDQSAIVTECDFVNVSTSSQSNLNENIVAYKTKFKYTESTERAIITTALFNSTIEFYRASTVNIIRGSLLYECEVKGTIDNLNIRRYANRIHWPCCIIKTKFKCNVTKEVDFGAGLLYESEILSDMLNGKVVYVRGIYIYDLINTEITVANASPRYYSITLSKRMVNSKLVVNLYEESISDDVNPSFSIVPPGYASNSSIKVVAKTPVSRLDLNLGYYDEEKYTGYHGFSISVNIPNLHTKPRYSYKNYVDVSVKAPRAEASLYGNVDIQIGNLPNISCNCDDDDNIKTYMYRGYFTVGNGNSGSVGFYEIVSDKYQTRECGNSKCVRYKCVYNKTSYTVNVKSCGCEYNETFPL